MVVLSKWESGVAFETLPLDTLREADLAERFMPGVDFQDADLTGASLKAANCDHARFRYAVLRNADLSGAVLVEADFSFADLRDADLRGAMLEAANVRAARLDGANLRGATYSAATIWPVGFEPAARGAVLIAGLDPDEHFQPGSLEEPASIRPAERIRLYAAPSPYQRAPWQRERIYAAIAFLALAALTAVGLLLR